MAAQKGKDLLLKMSDGASFVTVAGLRSRRIAFNAETVDVTHAESTERWRELLAGRPRVPGPQMQSRNVDHSPAINRRDRI